MFLEDLEVVVGPKVVIFTCDEDHLSFPRDHSGYERAKEIAIEFLETEELTEEVWEELKSINSIVDSLIQWSNDRIQIKGNRVLFDGDYVPSSLEDHMLALFNSGASYALEAWTKFLAKLREASHEDTYNRLHAFLKHNDLSINEEGNVLAWKSVRNDFKDIYSGTIDNSVGTTVVMPRVKVNHNPSQTCSHGLHLAAISYARNFGGPDSQFLLCEVDVRDIVSVPTDYNGEKIRCCKYKVLHCFGKLKEGDNFTASPQELIERYYSLTE